VQVHISLFNFAPLKKLGKNFHFVRMQRGDESTEPPDKKSGCWVLKLFFIRDQLLRSDESQTEGLFRKLGRT
jgi:hypothetical protein